MPGLARFFRELWVPFPAMAERRAAYESLQGYPPDARGQLVGRGLRSRDPEIRAVCDAVSKPVNVLAFPDMSLDRVAAAGARRVSLGSWLAQIAMTAAMGAAGSIRETGDFSALRPRN